MKKSIILGLSAIGMTIVTANCYAESDDQKYPATNFQPKVLFIDESAVQMPSVRNSFDPKYPAANFQPKVIFIDKAASASSSQKKKAVFDPKFPAANFEPKIIFPAS